MEHMSLETSDRVELLRDRCSALYNRMSSFPDRPSWQLESIAMIVQLAELLSLLDSRLAVAALNLDEVSKKVSSLELKYSELLYHLSGRN